MLIYDVVPGGVEFDAQRRHGSRWNRFIFRNIPPVRWLNGIVNLLEGRMKNRLTVSLIAASLLASSAAFAQSTTATGAVNAARTVGEIPGQVAEAVGGTRRA